MLIFKVSDVILIIADKNYNYDYSFCLEECNGKKRRNIIYFELYNETRQWHKRL